jgi:hypothetical protein
MNKLTNSTGFNGKVTTKGLKLQTFNSYSYRVVVKYLRVNEDLYHYFQNKEHKHY